MTNTADTQTEKDTLLSKLGELDRATLDTIAQNPDLIEEMKGDNNSMRLIEDAVRKAIKHNPAFAEQLRQVFTLDFLTLLSVNLMMGMGEEWFVAIRTMLFKKPGDFVVFKNNWKIPEHTVKFYGLRCLFPNGVEIKSQVIIQSIMAVTGLTSEDMEGYRGELVRRKRINQELSKTGDAVHAVIAADIN